LHSQETNPKFNEWKRKRGRPYSLTAKSLLTTHLDLLEKWRFIRENDISFSTPVMIEDAFMKHYGMSRKVARSYGHLFMYLHLESTDLPKDLDTELMKRKKVM